MQETEFGCPVRIGLEELERLLREKGLSVRKRRVRNKQKRTEEHKHETT